MGVNSEYCEHRVALGRLVRCLGGAILLTLAACAHQVAHPTKPSVTSIAASPPSSPPPSIPAAPKAASANDASRPSDAELLALPDPIPRAEPKARLGNPASYVALGQRYEVLNQSKGYVERGVASWYGPNFHGALTSVGEPYNMYALTGAHRILPLPCYARITNLKNGRSVVVRLNDRGPFKDNRIVDLSYTAALKLDMLREGTAFVELRVIDPGQFNEPALSSVAQTLNWFAQVGAFSEKSNADQLQRRLSAGHFRNVQVVNEITGGKSLWKVRIGPIDSVAAYDALVTQLHSEGFSAVTLVDGQRLSNRTTP